MANKVAKSIPWFGEVGCPAFGSLQPLKYPFRLITSNSDFMRGPYGDVDKLNKFASYYDTQPNDVIFSGYPKTGSHFTHRLVSQIIKYSDKDNVHPLYANGDVGQQAFPFMEMMLSHLSEQEVKQRIDATSDTLRMWWNHDTLQEMHFKSIHPETKIICYIRNPKDTVVSAYHFWHKLADDLQLDISEESKNFNIDDMVSYFLRGIGIAGCYFDFYEKWWLSYKNNGCERFGYNLNILWLYYEDILDNRRNEIEKIANFIGKNNLTDEEYDIIVENTDIKKSRNDVNDNPQSFQRSVDVMLRNGKNDDWENTLNEKQSLLIDETMFIKWARNLNDVRYYQPLFEKFKDQNIGYF